MEKSIDAFVDQAIDTADAELLIDKNRSGPTGLVKLHWAAEFARFDSAAESWRDETKGFR